MGMRTISDSEREMLAAQTAAVLGAINPDMLEHLANAWDEVDRVDGVMGAGEVQEDLRRLAQLVRVQYGALRSANRRMFGR